MNARSASIISAAVALAAAPCISFAVTAKNMTTNQVIFESNGFESDAINTPPSATGAGTWVAYHIDKVIADPSPGPFAGTNYVTTTRDNQGAGGPEAHFSANQTTNGDQIHVEWPMYIPSGADDALILHNSSTYYRGLGRITGGQYLNYDGAVYAPTGLFYTPNTWQTWTIDYTIGATSYIVGVDGNTVATNALDGISNIGGGSFDGLYFGHNGNDTFYIDGTFTGPPQPPQWIRDGSGSWNDSNNWIGGVPNGVGALAQFLSASTGAHTVLTDIDVTVGTLNFDNANMYLIAGVGSLRMETSSGPAVVNVANGGHKINLPLTFASNTDVTVAGGATLTIADPATISAGRTVTTSGTVKIEAPLTVEAGAALVVNSQGASLFGAPSLGAGSKVDVKTNSLTIDYRGLAGQADAVKAQLISGRAGGAWNGEGINTSTAIAGETGLGWKDDAANQQILVKYTYLGDANLDGKVDVGDLGALATNWQLAAPWVGGDFDYSGTVNVGDLGILATNWQKGASSPLGPSFAEALAALGLPGVSVPEPAGIVLMGVIGSIIAGRRRRQTVA